MSRRPVLMAIVVLGLAAGAAQASTVVGLSVEDQARLSRYVVIGEVIGQKGVDHPAQGIETAVTLKVTEVMKGDLRPGRAVVFHTRGGQVGEVISEAIGEAVFKKGQKALVFIEEIDGRLYNLGLSMGVWDIHEDAAGRQLATRALRDDLEVVGAEAVEHGPVDIHEMAARVGYAVRNPRFDSEILRAALGQGR